MIDALVTNRRNFTAIHSNPDNLNVGDKFMYPSIGEVEIISLGDRRSLIMLMIEMQSKQQRKR